VAVGPERIADAGFGRLGREVGLEEGAGHLRHRLGADEAGLAVGLPDERDGLRVIEAGRLQRAGDAVGGLGVVGVHERLVGDLGRDGVHGAREGQGGVAEEVQLVVDPAPVVGGVSREHVEVHAAGLLVDFAEARGVAAQGRVPEGPVEPV
jgi:hypothetical protein